MCKSMKNYSPKRLHHNGICNKAFMTKYWNQSDRVTLRHGSRYVVLSAYIPFMTFNIFFVRLASAVGGIASLQLANFASLL